MNYWFLRNTSNLTILVLLLSGSISAWAELSRSEKEVLMNALGVEPKEGNESCAYTQTSREPIDEEATTYMTTVSRYDPSVNAESPWTLLAVDEVTPSEEQIANFERTINKVHDIRNVGIWVVRRGGVLHNLG